MNLFKNILMALVVIATLFTAMAVLTPEHYTPTTCKWCGDVDGDLVSTEDIHANLIPVQNKD